VRLDTFALAGPEEPAARRHQAPTLIGCKLLKIASLNSAKLRHRLASLHQQQRNEIMQNPSQFVN
jgi:hypothetical protein